MSTKIGLDKLLKKYNVANGWIYAGGRRRKVFTGETDYEFILQETNHSKYWEKHIRPALEREYDEMKINYPDYYPSIRDECVCEHHISENCFIIKKKENELHIRVIGNCCIKKFGLAGRKCELCNETHRNRKDNLCHTCREEQKGICGCGKKKMNPKHPLCRTCYYQKMNPYS
jgi:hypothetical protein